MTTKEDSREKNLEMNNDDNEFANEDQLVRKREKKKKSKEERIKERRVVFWTLLVMVLITFGFWLMPRIRGYLKGERLFNDEEENDQSVPARVNPANRNYVEITL